MDLRSVAGYGLFSGGLRSIFRVPFFFWSWWRASCEHAFHRSLTFAIVFRTVLAPASAQASWTRSAAHPRSLLEQQGRHLLSRATLNGHRGIFWCFIKEICSPYLTVWRDLDRYCVSTDEDSNSFTSYELKRDGGHEQVRFVVCCCVFTFSHDFCLLRSSVMKRRSRVFGPKSVAALSDGSCASICASLWVSRSACGQELDF